MTKALERAARAILEREEQHEPDRLEWDDVQGSLRGQYLEEAQEAITAFLDPSDEEMVEQVARILATHSIPAYADDAIWQEDLPALRKSAAHGDTGLASQSFNLARAALQRLRDIAAGAGQTHTEPSP